MFTPVWLPILLLYVVGIGAVARLFAEVVAAQASERSRREAAELRAVATLATAAAHEINNPLMAVIGGLSLVERGIAPDSEQARWIAGARQGAEQIRDIVKRMNRITVLEEMPLQGALPPMLDIRKSSAPS
jgi:signal transduction histidine kinase